MNVRIIKMDLVIKQVYLGFLKGKRKFSQKGNKLRFYARPGVFYVGSGLIPIPSWSIGFSLVICDGEIRSVK